MKTTREHDERIANITFASVYPHYIKKVETKGRTKEELHQVIKWLTGFDEKILREFIDEKVTFKEFFRRARLNPNAHLITGVICGYRIEEIENPLTRRIRYLDKLIDELAKGKRIEKILRSSGRMTTIPSDIHAYNNSLSGADQAICNALAQEISNGLPESESKIWHNHPVWFLNGNPVVGYSKLKTCIRLLFWSGQSFEEPALQKEGKFKAAEIRYTSIDQISIEDLRRWLKKSKVIQWDYKNIVKRKGVLERLI